MLELAILGLLLESPMHGYELRKRLTGLLGAFRAFSYGSLYPTLRRVQDGGLIVEDESPGAVGGAPGERAHEPEADQPDDDGAGTGDGRRRHVDLLGLCSGRDGRRCAPNP